MSDKRFSLDDDFSQSPSDGVKRLDSDDFSAMRADPPALEEPDFDLQEGDYPEFVRPMSAITDADDSQRPTISANPSDVDSTDMSRQTVVSDVRQMVVDDQDERPTMLARRQELPPIDDRVRGVMTKKEPSRRPNRGFAPGCVTIGLLFSAASLGIALLAAFVPPFADSNPLAESLWETDSESSIELTTDETQVTHEGLLIDLPSQSEGEGFGVSIQSASASDFMAGNTPSENWQCGPAQSLPRSLSVQSAVYSLQSEGQAPSEVGLEFTLPAPDNSQAAMSDLYGWFGEAWQFIPSQPSSTSQSLTTRLPRLPLCLLLVQAQAPLPLVGVTLGLDQALDPAIGSSINRLFVGGMQPTAQGALQGVLPSGLESSAGYSLIPTVANFRDPAVVDVLTLEILLSDPTLRTAHAQQLAAFAASGNYNGLALDYRDIPAQLRQQYSELVRLLAEALHAQNQRLILFLPPAQLGDSGWETGAYEWRTLGWWADELVVRASADLGSFPDGQAEAMLRWAVGEVNRSQLFWGLSALSSDQASAIPADLAWEGLSRSGYSTLEASIEGEFGLISLSYMDEDAPQRQFWINSPTVLSRQMGVGARMGLGGVVVLDIAQAEEGDWAAPLQAYQDGALSAGLESPSLHWRILDEQGTLVEEQTAQVGQPIRYDPGSVAEASQFEAVLIAPEGDFTLASGSLAPASAPQTVAIAPSTPTLVAAQVSPTATLPSVSPTATLAPASPTPTLLPATSTPLPSATFTATIPPTATLTPTMVPTINAPLVQGVLPAEFEIGVHKGYEYTDEKFNLMRIGGMIWVKVQIRYTPGMNADDYGWQVQYLHERGLKILWGVVGDKNEVLSPGYAQQYAEFVARLAEIGSDAIEIWNEPNLDREWPTGQVSGASYTEFLRTSYIAIKAKNPDTMVISAATAPTGFFGGCQAAGCDDNVFYQQMASAGAAQYMDCIGAHYNEGIVPPTATSGDPRSEYPTRYLLPNTDRAWQPFGGQLPVCYTELGYLTPEGFDGPLPRGFEWAQNVTVAQQASWLATTALMLAQSGKVRLMIIWNLDYQDYDPDPHGGFAIIRPDGSCPACDSLGLIKATPVPGGQ